MHISVKLDSEHDRDIITWLESFGGRKRSEAVRAAIRTHLAGGTSESQILNRLASIERMMRQGVTLASPGETPNAVDTPEMEEARAALANLANL